MPVRLATILLFISVLTALTLATDVPTKRKHKKFDPLSLNLKDGADQDVTTAISGGGLLEGKKTHRFPRQTNLNERRQYYPCISCFRIGTREVCTQPYCPGDDQCDRASKRCHKKANVRGRPEEEVVEAAPTAAPATNAGGNVNTGGRGKK